MKMSSLTPTSDSSSHPLDANQFFASPRGQRLLTAVADKTGIDTSELKSRLLGGTSLQEILRSKQLTFTDIQQALHSMGSRSDSARGTQAEHPADAATLRNPLPGAAYAEDGTQSSVQPQAGHIDARA